MAMKKTTAQMGAIVKSASKVLGKGAKKNATLASKMVKPKRAYDLESISKAGTKTQVPSSVVRQVKKIKNASAIKNANSTAKTQLATTGAIMAGVASLAALPRTGTTKVKSNSAGDSTKKNTLKKSTTKMKKGGTKKTLRKAQAGMATTPPAAPAKPKVSPYSYMVGNPVKGEKLREVDQSEFLRTTGPKTRFERDSMGKPVVPMSGGKQFTDYTPMGTKKKGGSKKSMPKAQLGSIVKGAIKGAKSGYKSAKAAKAAKKSVGYGDKGQYARLEDMKRSEFYRDRHNAGKTYSGSGSSELSKTGKAIYGTVLAGTVGTALTGVIKGEKEQRLKKANENKKKVAANKAKVTANAAKYKKAYGGSTKLKKAQEGAQVQTKNIAPKKSVASQLGIFGGAGLGIAGAAFGKKIAGAMQAAKERRVEKKKEKAEAKKVTGTKTKLAKNKK